MVEIAGEDRGWRAANNGHRWLVKANSKGPITGLGRLRPKHKNKKWAHLGGYQIGTPNLTRAWRAWCGLADRFFFKRADNGPKHKKENEPTWAVIRSVHQTWLTHGACDVVSQTASSSSKGLTRPKHKKENKPTWAVIRSAHQI